MTLSSGVGLISGLNFNDIIAQLSAINQRPIQILVGKQRVFGSRQAALQGINKALLDLQTAMNSLKKADNFSARRISISDTDVANVSAKNTATVGSFSFKTLQLAQSNRIASQGFDTADETPIAAANGVFSFKIGNGTITSLNVTSTTTLNQLRDAINSDTDSGVRASIINDGTTTNPYRLVLTSTNTGADNDITIVSNDTTLNLSTKSIEAATAGSKNSFDGTVTSSGTYTGTGTTNFVVKVTTLGTLGVAKFAVSTDGGLTFGPADEFTTSGTPVDIGSGVEVSFGAGTADFAVGDTFNIDAFDPSLQQAQDAIVEIDGIQIRRSSNTIADVVDGVTITAKAVSTEESTITVNNDNANSVGPIKAFTIAYNKLVDEVKAVASFDKDTNVRGPLFGDSTVRNIRSSLSDILSTALPGITKNNSIGAIGIKLQSDGKLVVDDAKLNEVLESDFLSVQRLFAAIGTSTSTGISFSSASGATIGGTFNVNITTVAAKATATGAQAVDGAGITNAEKLTFTQGGKTMTVTLNAGSTLDEAVEDINSVFEFEGLTLKASNDNGVLKIESDEYGSTEKFTVKSDQSGAVSSQLGIGTSLQSLTGVDVAGTINGVSAKGEGQFLTAGDTSKAKGLKLFIGSASPVTGTITFSRGIADRMSTAIEGITNTTDGLIKSKTDSLKSSIEGLNDSIERLQQRVALQEKRLKSQFTGLELKLNDLQTQGNFLLSQLASLAGG